MRRINLVRKNWFEGGHKGKEYTPKKSKRYKRTSTAPGDQDTWTEHVVIVDKSSYNLRSYFQSKLTGRCVWDEPPTGASNIVPFQKEERL